MEEVSRMDGPTDQDLRDWEGRTLLGGTNRRWPTHQRQIELGEYGLVLDLSKPPVEEQ
jgi:hypothetical protein